MKLIILFVLMVFILVGKARAFNLSTDCSLVNWASASGFGCTTLLRTFNFPSRSLNSCFQISSAQDADFHYKVDVTTGLSLTNGAQGGVIATAYTNSGCSTGAQVIADGTAGQSGTLIVGLGISQVLDVSLDGTLPKNEWMKLTTTNTVGTPTYAIRPVQAEILLP